MVKLFRSNQALIVAIGLTRDSVQRLTDRLNAFLNFRGPLKLKPVCDKERYGFSQRVPEGPSGKFIGSL